MKKASSHPFKTLKYGCFLLIILFTTLINDRNASAQTQVFFDDFNGGSLNTKNWSIGTWNLGRTKLGNTPVFGTEPNTTYARLTFDTYQFKGTEIYSVNSFARGNGLEIEARVRLNNLPSGLVTSLFTYTYDTSTATSDEIDIEILSKRVLQTFNGDPVLFTTWNNWSEASPTYQDGTHHYSNEVLFPNFNVNGWHIYTIRWLPTGTEWLIDGQVVYSSSKALPEAPTPVRLNFWAPASSWTDAYDPNLKQVSRPKNNTRYYYDVDYVKVTQLP
ncbi:MAG: glycoside hydrolase family 16 protein [Hyphomicrobium sp.]